MEDLLILLLLNPYFILPLILSCLLPLQWIKRFWIFVIIIGFGITAFETQSSFSNDHGGTSYILGIIILTTYGILLSTIIISRMAIEKLRLKDRTTSPTKENLITATDNFLFSVGGIVSSIFIFKFLAFSLSSLPHGFLIHGLLSLVFLSLILGTWKLLFPKKLINQKVSAFILLLLCSLFLFSASGILYPYIVIKNARTIAGKRPYCIGLNKQERSVSSLEDLIFLTMDKNHVGHHAFLLIEKEDHGIVPYHWSYIQSKFIQGVLNWGNDNQPPIPCHPKLNFSDNLPLIENNTTQNIEFYMHDHFLKIPTKYYPYISSNYLSISVKAPSFEPSIEEAGTLSPSMEIRSRDWLESLQTQYSNLPVTGRIGNLSEIKNMDTQTNWYSRFNKNGQLETVISCYKGRPVTTSCQHRFYKNNAMYSFDHSADLLPQSDKMEKDLFDLFENFKEK